MSQENVELVLALMPAPDVADRAEALRAARLAG